MKKIIGLFLCILVLSACSSSDEPKLLDVQLVINPETADINSPVIFKAEVTYGGEPVENADEVKFEVWRSKSDNHETVVVEHTEDGVYVLEKSFAEEGTYYVYAHVTAENMHAMPKKEFVIGEPSEPEENSKSKTMNEHEEESDDHSH